MIELIVKEEIVDELAKAVYNEVMEDYFAERIDHDFP